MAALTARCAPRELEDAGSVRIGAGSDDCRHTGYSGRIGIFELLSMDDPIRDQIKTRPDSRKIRDLAIAGGMRTLRGDGLRQILAGRTTPEEVLRVTLA